MGKNVAVCLACNAAAEQHPHTAVIAGVRFSLCGGCWAKVERPGRRPAQTIDAIILMSGPHPRPGAQRELGDEDREDMVRLGLSPGDVKGSNA